jgi:hypothetical protein
VLEREREALPTTAAPRRESASANWAPVAPRRRRRAGTAVLPRVPRGLDGDVEDAMCRPRPRREVVARARWSTSRGAPELPRAASAWALRAAAGQVAEVGHLGLRGDGSGPPDRGASRRRLQAPRAPPTRFARVAREGEVEVLEGRVWPASRPWAPAPRRTAVDRARDDPRPDVAREAEVDAPRPRARARAGSARQRRGRGRGGDQGGAGDGEACRCCGVRVGTCPCPRPLRPEAMPDPFSARE